MKCIDCNAPVVPTVDDSSVSDECGESPISGEDITPDIIFDEDDYSNGHEMATGNQPSENLAE